MASLFPEFDAERLNRQENFYLDRARAHDNAKDARRFWHAACAACLTRDAASIALLRGDAKAASSLFQRAGTRFAEIGVFAGLQLLEVGHWGASRQWRENHPDFDHGIERAVGTPDDTSARTDGAPSEKDVTLDLTLLASSASPRQLLYLYYAMSIQNEQDEITSHLLARVRARMKPFAELPVGATGLPLQAYVQVLDELTNTNVLGKEGLSGRARDVLLSAILRRSEQLRAAQADRWHWTKLINPGDLVDLDLLALATLTVDRFGSTEPLDKIVGDRDMLAVLPLRAARLLRAPLSPQYEEH